MVHDQAAAFALDALEPEESVEFERHLAVCPACEDGLEPLRFVAAALAFAGELPEPRAQLRLRVLDVGAPVIPLHRRYRGQLLSAAAVAAVCLVLTAVLQPWQADRGRGDARRLRLPRGGARDAAPRAGACRRTYEAWIVDRGRVAPAGLGPRLGSPTHPARPRPAPPCSCRSSLPAGHRNRQDR
jgi:hypothetical protein